MKKINDWKQYNEKVKEEKEVELTSHDKMWNSVSDNFKDIISAIKGKSAEELVSALKNKVADGKLKFKDIESIKRNIKSLKELMS